MRKLYDAQVEQLTRYVVRGHGYEPYPILFNRNVGWDRKASVLDASEANSPSAVKGGKSKKKAVDL